MGEKTLSDKPDHGVKYSQFIVSVNCYLLHSDAVCLHFINQFKIVFEKFKLFKTTSQK